MQDVYEQLRERLDDLAVGFPSTTSGVELKILRRLFNPEEAEFFLKMAPIPEAPVDAARRMGLDAEHTAELMEKMAEKGLLFRVRKGENVKYAAVPFIVGIFEFQLNSMDRELAGDLKDYFEEGLGHVMQGNSVPVMRSIPINRELVAEWPIAPYEDAIQIVEAQETIAVAPCICRTSSRLLDEGCDKPLEACFMFGSHAHFYVENGMGRYITQDEAKDILRRNEEEGLVLQPYNTQKVGGMCSCCGDCCGMLRSLKKQPSPAQAVKSNYFAVVAEDDCIGCETCIDRCQMEAIVMVDDKAKVDLNRCIGCGLCISTCSGDALRLVKKAETDQYTPPRSGVEHFLALAKERKKNVMPRP